MPVQRYVRIAEPVAAILLLCVCLVLVVRHAGRQSAAAFESADTPAVVAPQDIEVPPARFDAAPARALLKIAASSPAVFAEVASSAEDATEVVMAAHAETAPRPLVKDGSFELAAQGSAESPWYYLQHATVVETPTAPEGMHALRFDNSIPGRHAQAQQHLEIDGRQIRAVHVATWAKLSDVGAGQSLNAQPGVRLQFYDEDLTVVSQEGIDCGLGTQGWTQHEAQFSVPASARSALVIVGLLGGTGRAEFDQLEMRPVDLNPSVLPPSTSR